MCLNGVKSVRKGRSHEQEIPANFMMRFDLLAARLVGGLFAPWQRRWAARPQTLPSTKPVTMITGATVGIGNALALELGRGGDDLFLLGRDVEKLAALATRLKPDVKGEVYTLAVDFKEADFLPLIEAFLTREGLHVERLINNAGLGERDEFLKTDPALLDEILAVNIRALSLLTRAFLTGMIERGHGAILNVASLGGLAPAPFQSIYYSSKAYVIHLSEALAHEFAGRGVYIAALCPGPTKTDFHKKIQARRALYLLIMGQMAPARVARAAHRALLMRHWALITPGPLSPFIGLALRVIPGSLLAPFMGLLFKKW